MRILFINSVYKEKSTGNIVESIRKHAADKGNITRVIYGRGSNHNNALKVQNKFDFLINVTASRITGKIWDCLAKKQTNRIIKVIEDFKPDIINIHQLYGYYLNPSQLVKYLSSKNIKTIITLHDFTIITGKCGYPLSCKKYTSCCQNCERKHKYPKTYFMDRTKSEFNSKKTLFNNASNFTFVAVSSWLMNKAMLSPIINNSPITYINNGIDTNLFAFSEKEKNKNSVIVISTNFKDEMKGGDFLIQIIKETLKKNTNINFILIGKYSTYIAKKFNENRVNAMGYQTKSVISKCYNQAFCSLITSKCETFSLPTVESLCAGVPVIGPNDCGAPTCLSNNSLADFTSERDYKQIASKIIELYFNKPATAELKALSHQSKIDFNQNLMNEKYLLLFNELKKYEKK